MLSQALFYQEGARFKKLVEIDNEKWFAKTSDEWFDDTGITEEAQEPPEKSWNLLELCTK